MQLEIWSKLFHIWPNYHQVLAQGRQGVEELAGCCIKQWKSVEGHDVIERCCKQLERRHERHFLREDRKNRSNSLTYPILRKRQISTDQNRVGRGESFGFAAAPAVKVAIDQIIAPRCIGCDPSLIGKFVHELQVTLHIFGRSGAISFGLSSLDIALWDLDRIWPASWQIAGTQIIRR